MSNNSFFNYLSFEDKEHIRVVNYIKDKLPEVIALHVPNEGERSSFQKYRLSLMGILKGFPDFIFLHPKYESNNSTKLIYLGLAIELKAQDHRRVVMKGRNAGKVVNAKGKLSDEQNELLKKMNDMGYKAVCCFGADEAIKVIDEYFKDFYELQKELKIVKH